MLDDAPRWGRPVEVDSDQIETLIENNQCYTMWEIADIFKISKSIVIGKNEKCVFLFYGKNLNGLSGQPNTSTPHPQGLPDSERGIGLWVGEMGYKMDVLENIPTALS